jgi:hypothetical protein
MTWLSMKAILTMCVWRVEWLPTALFDALLLPLLGIGSPLSLWVLKRQIDSAARRNVRLYRIRAAMDRYLGLEDGDEFERADHRVSCAEWWN